MKKTLILLSAVLLGAACAPKGPQAIPTDKEEDHPGYAKLVQQKHSLTGGSTYDVIGLEGFNRDIWLCPVTLFVLGKYPKYMYIKKADC